LIEEDPESKIYIIIKNGVPMMLGSLSTVQYRDELHKRIWDKAHKKSKKDGISLLKALKIQIKRAGFDPEEVKKE
jgi:hypothetical protein